MPRMTINAVDEGNLPIYFLRLELDSVALDRSKIHVPHHVQHLIT